MSAIDQMGFIPLDELQNVFCTELQKIEHDLKVNGIPADKKIIVEFIDSIRLRLMSRAKDNLQKYLIHNPQIKAEIRQEKALKEAEDTRKTWQERVSKNRMKAALSEQ